jgi:hypothetical protein
MVLLIIMVIPVVGAEHQVELRQDLEEVLDHQVVIVLQAVMDFLAELLEYLLTMLVVEHNGGGV